MKRVFAAIMAAVMLLCGCNAADSQKAGQHSRPENVEMNQSTERPKRQEGENHSRPQKGEGLSDEKTKSQKPNGEITAEPAAEKTVSGKVESIVGNEVTLLVSENGVETSEKYLLPVGMKIGDKDFSSVKAGNTLKISFSTHPEDGSEMIVAVEISSNRR